MTFKATHNDDVRFLKVPHVTIHRESHDLYESNSISNVQHKEIQSISFDESRLQLATDSVSFAIRQGLSLQ